MSAPANFQFDNPVHMMEVIGGSFVRSLAACYLLADQQNRAILREAFAGYFDNYERRFAAWQGNNVAEAPQGGGVAS